MSFARSQYVWWTNSQESLLISGKLLRYGNTREPPANISSVEILSTIFSKTGSSKRSGKLCMDGIEAILGPFSRGIFFASSNGKGSSNKLWPSVNFSGSVTVGYGPSNVRGSVIFPDKAEAAAVSGLHRNTLSSFVPDLPGKFLGVVRTLFVYVARACPIPIQLLPPA